MEPLGVMKMFTIKVIVATVTIFNDIGNHNDQK